MSTGAVIPVGKGAEAVTRNRSFLRRGEVCNMLIG